MESIIIVLLIRVISFKYHELRKFTNWFSMFQYNIVVTKLRRSCLHSPFHLKDVSCNPSLYGTLILHDEIAVHLKVEGRM